MKNEVPSLQRGCDILKKVSEKPGISATELGDFFAIPKASLNRMLKCLLDNGFLSQNLKTKGLFPGWTVLEMIVGYYENDPLTFAVRPMLSRLAEKWQATFVVYEYEDPFKIVWRSKHEPSNGVKTRAPGVVTAKMNMNAQGQLFISMLDNKKIKEFFSLGLAYKATEYTIMDYNKMLERAGEIRRKGYAFQQQENSLSSKQFAVPLVFRNIPGVFALGCFLNLSFQDEKELVQDMLCEAGKFLSIE